MVAANAATFTSYISIILQIQGWRWWEPKRATAQLNQSVQPLVVFSRMALPLQSHGRCAACPHGHPGRSPPYVPVCAAAWYCLHDVAHPVAVYLLQNKITKTSDTAQVAVMQVGYLFAPTYIIWRRSGFTACVKSIPRQYRQIRLWSHAVEY